ncbi:hypothetical protein [Leptospira weilii]|uniref:Uncharacterized protein n=1 Tax=Leptospira weilii str. UI 13098 TaxID=1088542 RepID=M6QDV7_9LEPT|nr:hypothetical protein [Leptospira weilii]EMN91390.1 hypothetical protein LEP1GSC108_3292 [Leptospira weilii str. UI 13098]
MSETTTTDVSLVPKTEISEREEKARAIFLDQRIWGNLTAFMFDLKEMRDRKYFEKLGYESFQNYLSARKPSFIPISFAQNVLLLSDKITQEDYSNYDENNTPTLINLAKDSDVYQIKGQGKVILLDGRELSIDEYESIRAEEIAQTTKVYQEALTLVGEHKKLQRDKKKSDRDLEVNEKLVTQQNGEISKLKEALDYVAQERGIDADHLTAIATKQGASKHITDLYVKLEQAITSLNSIDETLKSDIDIAGSVLQFESLLKLSVTKLNAAWNPHFFALQDQGSED